MDRKPVHQKQPFLISGGMLFCSPRFCWLIERTRSSFLRSLSSSSKSSSSSTLRRISHPTLLALFASKSPVVKVDAFGQRNPFTSPEADLTFSRTRFLQDGHFILEAQLWCAPWRSKEKKKREGRGVGMGHEQLELWAKYVFDCQSALIVSSLFFLKEWL